MSLLITTLTTALSATAVNIICHLYDTTLQKYSTIITITFLLSFLEPPKYAEFKIACGDLVFKAHVKAMILSQVNNVWYSDNSFVDHNSHCSTSSLFRVPSDLLLCPTVLPTVKVEATHEPLELIISPAFPDMH